MIIISKNERNTIILRHKIERRNEMPVEGVSYLDYSCIFKVKTRSIPAIKNVIFNEPATIVFWEDGSKTVVKCQDGDIYDPEKGLAMAISKKALGNQGNYCNEFKNWLSEENEVEKVRDDSNFNEKLNKFADVIRDAVSKKKDE